MGFRGRFGLVFLLFFFIGTLSTEAANISLEELRSEIHQGLDRVEEFRVIREEAAKIGVKVYLFGGTAAAFAHYVKWDSLRKRGDTSYQPDRFNYEFTNIFRSTQDLDLVVDGTEQQAAILRKVLSERFPYLQGDKSDWELRLLRTTMGDKIALLDNPDFLNQHTDSHSVGLIELSNGESEEKDWVKDLRDWESESPQFLEDVTKGELHFYYSKEHLGTSRARNGMNPEIFSAIRYLTKAFQFDLKMSPADLEKIQGIIGNAKATTRSDSTNYVYSWLERNLKKMLLHSVNIEYACEMIQKLKLASAFEGMVSSSWMGWVWLKKAALKSAALGEGDGQTAAELGLDIVAHDTMDFLAYESITRAHSGEPNVFISRANGVGEAAAYGDGFYTRVGKVGARGTGITIRFKVNPEAREGTDFIRVADDYVIFRNKAAIRVIQESVELEPEDFWRLFKANALSEWDKGLIYKLKRRVMARASVSISKAFIDELMKDLSEGINVADQDAPNSYTAATLAWNQQFIEQAQETFWSSAAFQSRLDKLFVQMLRTQPSKIRRDFIFSQILKNPRPEKMKASLDELFSKSSAAEIGVMLGKLAEMKDLNFLQPGLLKILKRATDYAASIESYMKIVAPEVLEIYSGNIMFLFNRHLSRGTMPEQRIASYKSALQSQLSTLRTAAINLMSESSFVDLAPLIEDLIQLKDSNLDKQLVEQVLNRPNIVGAEDFLLKILKRNLENKTLLASIVENVIGSVHGPQYERLVRELLKIEGLQLGDALFNRENIEISRGYFDEFLKVASPSQVHEMIQFVIDTRNPDIFIEVLEKIMSEHNPTMVLPVLFDSPYLQTDEFNELRRYIAELAANASIKPMKSIPKKLGLNDCRRVLKESFGLAQP